MQLASVSKLLTCSAWDGALTCTAVTMRGLIFRIGVVGQSLVGKPSAAATSKVAPVMS